MEYRLVEVDGRLRVDGTKCGMVFEGIAWVDEPESFNPLITMNHLGLRAAMDVLELVTRRITTTADD